MRSFDILKDLDNGDPCASAVLDDVIMEGGVFHLSWPMVKNHQDIVFFHMMKWTTECRRMKGGGWVVTLPGMHSLKHPKGGIFVLS